MLTLALQYFHKLQILDKAALRLITVAYNLALNDLLVSHLNIQVSSYNIPKCIRLMTRSNIRARFVSTEFLFLNS